MTMKWTPTFLWIAALLLGTAALPARAADQGLRVAVSPAFSAPANEIKALFEADTGTRVTLFIGSSALLAQRIEQGFPYDLFLSENMAYPRMLFLKKVTDRPPRPYAVGQLVLWTYRDDIDLSRGLAALTDPRIKAIAFPEFQAPYGPETQAALSTKGLRNTIKDKLQMKKSIAAVTKAVYTHKADVGFTSLSSMQSSVLKNLGHWVPVNAGPAVSNVHGALILRSTSPEKIKKAEAFLSYVVSPRGQKILGQYGLRVPTATERNPPRGRYEWMPAPPPGPSRPPVPGRQASQAEPSGKSSGPAPAASLRPPGRN
jgi:molybdate transport system substrate-binding protein